MMVRKSYEDMYYHIINKISNTEKCTYQDIKNLYKDKNVQKDYKVFNRCDVGWIKELVDKATLNLLQAGKVDVNDGIFTINERHKLHFGDDILAWLTRE